MVENFVDLFDIALEPDSLAYSDEVLLAHLASGLRIVQKKVRKLGTLLSQIQRAMPLILRSNSSVAISSDSLST